MMMFSLKGKSPLFLSSFLLGLLSIASANPESEALYLEARNLSTGLGGVLDVKKADALYRQASDLGDPRALAWNYRRMVHGERGFPKDIEGAKGGFRKIEGSLERMAAENLPDAKRSLAVSWATIFPVEKGKAAFDILKSLSDEGRLDDLVSLARLYEEGIGVKKNPVEAFVLYRKSAKQGNVGAMGNLGDCYREGFGVAKDEKEAFRWYQKAAELGNDGARRQLAFCYEFGRGSEKDLTQAFANFLQLAEQGDAWAQNRVGWCLANGFGVSKDPAQAVAWYEKSAQQGNAVAMGNLGFCFEKGQGVAKHEKEAVRWYEKAADLGNTWSMNQVGLCYEEGRGVEKDPKKAFGFYLKSAEAGDAWGQKTVGHCFRNGFGTAQDQVRAFEWYKKSADQGHVGGLENLAFCFSRGQGVEKNTETALQYFQKAAEQGSAWAQAEAGRCYLEGTGTKQDKKIAMDWFRKAAVRGNHYGESMYGKALEEGWDGFPDREDAIPWYRKAAEAGNGWAWAALGQALEKETAGRDAEEVFRCYQKANWLGESWGTFLLASAYAKGTGVQPNPALAADLAERLIGTSQDQSTRQLLVDLHWGAHGPWSGANLEQGMEHWLVLHPQPAHRLATIYRTAKDLIHRGKPGAVAEVLALFEARQNADNLAFSGELKVFRAVTRLMADRHVPNSWHAGLPSELLAWSEKVAPYFREPNGGILTLSSGHLEIHEKSRFPFGPSSPARVADLWDRHLQWLARLLSEQESGWYRSFVRSLNEGERAVNLRWLQAGVSRVNEAGRDLVGLKSDQLSLGGVGGALLVSRLSENPALMKGLMARLDELDSKDLKEIKKKERKKSKKKTAPKLPGAYEQIRSLGESNDFASKWWREKGEITFGWGVSGSNDPGSGFLEVSQMFPIRGALDLVNQQLGKAFLRVRPDLVLKVGAYVEKMYDDPRFSYLGYGYLETVYETLANEVPESRRQALEALVRWNRARGNGVTADKWEETLQSEIGPKQADTEFSRKPKIPEDCKDAANRATSFYEAKKYEDCAKAYKEILQKYPDSLYALSNLGVVRFQQQKYPEAESALRKAVAISRSDAFSHSVLGIVLVQQEKYQEALDILRRAVELDPEDAKTRNYLGISCSRMGLQEEAERECRKAIELDEAYGDGHFNLAVIYATQSPPLKDRAKQHYQRALQLGISKDKDLEKLIR
jgi:TPR repeat protein